MKKMKNNQKWVKRIIIATEFYIYKHKFAFLKKYFIQSIFAAAVNL